MHFRCPQMFVHVPSGCLKCSNNMVILRNSHWLSWHSNIVLYSPQTLRLFIWVALSYILFSMQTLCWVFSVLPTVSPLFIFRIKINSVIIIFFIIKDSSDGQNVLIAAYSKGIISCKIYTHCDIENDNTGKKNQFKPKRGI